MSSAAWSHSDVASLTALLAVICSEAACCSDQDGREACPGLLTAVCKELRAWRDPEPQFGSWCRHDEWRNDG